MTTTGVEAIFVDTNILLYAVNSLSHWHTQANQALQKIRAAGLELFISSQVLREYLAVATKPLPGGIGMDVSSALEDIQQFRSQFTVVYEDKTVLNKLEQLLQHHPVSGRKIFDANLVATMQASGVTHLLTHNVTDFTRFAGLITIIPLAP